MEQKVENRAGGAAGEACRRIAIEAVLADVEIDRRQIGGCEGEECLEHALEVVARVAVADLRVELGHAVQDPFFKLGHGIGGDLLGVREILEVAQEEPQGVAQAAVAVGGAFQDLFADPEVNGVVGLRDPEAQDVGAVFVDHGLRGDGIAKRLGHLHALFVQSEAVGQNAAVRRAALGAAGLQHRGVEPAAVLVGALKVEVGDAVGRAVGTVAQDEGVGGA